MRHRYCKGKESMLKKTAFVTYANLEKIAPQTAGIAHY